MDYIAWLWLSLLYCVMVIIALIVIFVTCTSMWCHDVAVIIIWTWMYLYYVLMSLLWLWSSWSILIGFTLLRENRGLFWLASVGFTFHWLHPSITFQFCFQPDWLLDLWHGGPFPPTRTFVGQTSLSILCLGSELVTELSFGELDCMPKSFCSVVSMFGTIQNSP